MQIKAHLTFKREGGEMQTPCTIYKSIPMSLEEHRGTKGTPTSHAEKPTLPSPRTVSGKLRPHGLSGLMSQGKVLSLRMGWHGKIILYSTFCGMFQGQPNMEKERYLRDFGMNKQRNTER